MPIRTESSAPVALATTAALMRASMSDGVVGVSTSVTRTPIRSDSGLSNVISYCAPVTASMTV